MDVIYNSTNRIILCALPRCGTNYIRRFASKSKDWRNGARFAPSFRYHEHTIVKVVRDPFERWRSWFYTFGFDYCNPIHWTIDDAKKFIDDFSIKMHYDQHTGYQHILYTIDQNLNYNNKFVTMEKVGIFLGDSGAPHNPGKQHDFREVDMNPSVIEYLYPRIHELYRLDSNWIKSLDLWEENS